MSSPIPNSRHPRAAMLTRLQRHSLILGSQFYDWKPTWLFLARYVTREYEFSILQTIGITSGAFANGSNHGDIDPPADHHHNFDDSIFGDEFSVVGQASDGGTMSPMSSKSSDSSPSLSFTPEQHELKRQQDRVRRDSRLSARLRRYSNNAFADSTILGPTDAIGNLGLAVYNPTTHTTVPLMADSPQLMPTSSYMTPYSPTSSEQSHGYQLSYQQQLYVLNKPQPLFAIIY